MMTFATYANDLGVIGHTYPIEEVNFLDFIQAKLASMGSSGEITKLQTAMQQRVEKHADRPNPVPGITKAQINRVWLIDPSFTVRHDIKDALGKVIIEAGTNVNPLKYITIHHPMVFIDGDDQDEIKWLKKSVQYKLNDIKLVLTSGSISTLSKEFKFPIYFDQEGRLTSKLHIHHVPAIVSQQDLQLRVNEVVI